MNRDDLIYRYKGNTAGVNFDEFDNALDIIDKIQNGKIELANVKNNQDTFKTYLEKIKRTKKYFVQYWNALQSKKKSY